MNIAQGSLTKSLSRVIRRPGFWLIIALLVFITLPHYQETLQHPTFLTHLFANLGLTRHAFERILYLAPIVWAGFLFGRQGGIITSLAALACMLPRAITISPLSLDASFETGAVFILGNVLAITFNALHNEQKRRTHLAVLNQVSTVASQSLDLNYILNNIMDNVIQVMKADAALIYLLDEEMDKLVLAANKGISRTFASSIYILDIDESYNGKVAKSGQPLFVEDTTQAARFSELVGNNLEIRSEIIVPLRSQEKVSGTLCVGMHSHRFFQPDEVELLTAIGNQIGVALDNAKLYEQQQRIGAELRVSEERYRDLFENAHDAIWLHDLEDNIMTANKSLIKLTGYALGELTGTKADILIAKDCIDSVKETEDMLLTGEASGHISEVTLVRKDKTEAAVHLSTSPIFSDGQIAGFQHIARDVTDLKRIQENLRFYLEQVTRAQEEERKRIARELHDDTVQALVVLSRELDTLTSKKEGLPDENRLRLEGLIQQVDSIIDGVRRLSQDLRPAALDRLGLTATLKWLASNVAEYSGINTKVNITGDERRLSEEVELVLFRISQEALRNVWRHSQATEAEITVKFEDNRIQITVSDNGKGFNPPQTIGDFAQSGRLGFAGMEERTRLLGGTFKVQSEPGKGTNITTEIPIQP